MRAAHINGRQLAYWVDGSAGSPVLLIMGLGMRGEAWAHQVTDLAEQHRVVTFDHAGVGQSSPPDARVTIATLAHDALRTLDNEGIERAHIVGVSLGGMIAQELVLTATSRALSLTLIATHAGGLRRALPTGAGLRAFWSANRGRGRERIEAVARLLFPPAFLATCDPAWLRETLRRDFSNPAPPAIRFGQIKAALTHRAATRLTRLEGVPTLVIVPGQDILIRATSCRELAQLVPRARLLEVPDAGHGVVRQSAAQVNPALLAHFRSVDERLGTPPAEARATG